MRLSILLKPKKNDVLTTSLRNIITTLLTAIALAPSLLVAQHNITISGRVTDNVNKQAIAFVNIITDDGLSGTTTDIDGKYSLHINKASTTLIFSCVGYETMRIQTDHSNEHLNLNLQPTPYNLDEIVITADENPAHRLIDSLLAHRNDNNPDKLRSYSYTLYDKMVFTIDSSGYRTDSLKHSDTISADKSAFLGILRKNDIMVTETVSEQKFMAPDRRSQKVIGNKVSGLKNPMFIYLVSEIQSVSFYDENINIIEKTYLNPISKNSTKKYHFKIESSHISPDGDSIFVVSFKKRDKSNFDGLKGLLTINSNGWALQNVKAAPDNDDNAFYTIQIQQLYEKIDGHWFPRQLNTNIIFPAFAIDLDSDSFPLVAVGKSYLTDIKINPELDKRAFSEIEINVEKDAAQKDEEFWDNYRNDSLTQRVKDTYTFMDSVSKHVINLDKVYNTLNILSNNGALPLGPINIGLTDIIRLSNRNGWYFGIALSTNDKMLKWLRLRGMVGYYLKSKLINYSGGVDFTISKKKQTRISLEFYKKQVATSSFDRFVESDFLLDPLNYRYDYYEPYPAYEKAGKISVSSRLFAGTKGFASFTYGDRSYFEDIDSSAYLLLNDSSYLKARHAEMELKLRFAHKEKFVSTPFGIQSIGTKWPIVWLGYTHSFANIWGSQHSFDRLLLQIHEYFHTKHCGVSFVMLQAGITFGDIPIGEMITPLGTNYTLGLYSPGSFCTMKGNEFYCDRFIALYLSHNFGSTLWQTHSSWFNPEPVIATNLGWGNIADKRHQGLPTINKGFYESGIVINGIVNVAIMKLGFGVFYRYGPYSFDKTWDNFALKWNAIFNL